MDLENDLKADLALDMRDNELIVSCLEDIEIAKDFYRALCDVEWFKVNLLPEDEEIIERLKGTRKVWSCSWRSAGRIISDIRNQKFNTNESYLDFYCSGDEGNVSELVEGCFKKIGWILYSYL